MPIHHKGREEPPAGRLRLTTTRLRVFLWDEALSVEPVAGFSFLSDVSKQGVGVYLERKIRPGNPVRVAFERLDAATLRGSVSWANRFSFRQGFLGRESLPFLIGIKFLFGSEAERQRYLKFLRETEKRVLAIEPGMRF
jgi:hypothetical protein